MLGSLFEAFGGATTGALSQRAVRVRVEGSANVRVFEGLRVQFKIQKTSKREPNTAELSISNLNETSRAALQGSGVVIAIEAGYSNHLERIFSGEAIHTSHVREGADWVTKVQMMDGLRAYKYAKVSQSFKAGTKVSAVFSVVANALGVNATDAVAFVRQHIRAQFPRGYVAHGRAALEIENILRGRGLEWSIQDGRLQVTEVGKPFPGPSTAVLLSSATGLIGSPAYGSPEKVPGQPKKQQSVLKAKSLLQPGIRPGARVQLDSLTTSGLFRVEAVTHTGDTHGGEWTSDADLVVA